MGMDIVLKIDNRMKGFLGKFQESSNIAMVRTLNTQAALTRKDAIKNVKADFTIRNNFTTRQIQFEKATETRNTTLAYRAESRVGATKKAGYMKLQEEGGKKRNKAGSGNISIGRRAARGGSTGNVIQNKYHLRNITRWDFAWGGYTQFHKSKKAKHVALAAAAFKNKKLILANPKQFGGDLLYYIYTQNKRDNNYLFFPPDLSDVYIEQISSWKEDKNVKDGDQYENWKPTGPDHYFDCEKMMLVLIEFARKTLTDKQWRKGEGSWIDKTPTVVINNTQNGKNWGNGWR